MRAPFVRVCSVLTSVAAILAGFVLLIWAADRFVVGAAALAETMGVPKLLVGLLLVGLGTSAPEMFVAAVASFQGKTGLAMGNAIGSNITNIMLILGATALISPMVIQQSIARREMPVLLGVSLLAVGLCANGVLSRLDGVILMIGLFALLGWLARVTMADPEHAPALAADMDDTPPMPQARAIVWVIVGLVLLPASSQMLVWGAVNVALAIGVSDLVIGLTIVAIGTSLPELAASAVSALKGESEIAIGNVIGSNIFNLLAVLAMPALIAPGLVPADALSRDLPIMLAATVLLFIIVLIRRGGKPMARAEGMLLLAGFIGYEYLLFAHG